MMETFGNTRKIISQALDEMQSAEVVFGEILKTTTEEVRGSRTYTVDQDDKIDAALIRLRARSQNIQVQSSRILANVRLQQAQPAHFNLNPNIEISDALIQVQDIVELIENLYQEIVVLENRLVEERKKWWKFW